MELRVILGLVVLLTIAELQPTLGKITITLRHSKARTRVKRAWKYPEILLPENQPVGPLPYNFLTISSDSDQVAKYFLSGDSGLVLNNDVTREDTKFRFNTKTGVLDQVKELDREMKSQYSYVAYATDANGNKVEDNTDVIIKVTDQNDNKPVFIQSLLSGTVPEANDGTSPFMYVNVTDADIGANGRQGMSFSIDSEGASPPGASTWFRIDESSGEISVVPGNLDYETDKRVSFKVVATDSKGAVYGLSQKETVTVTVTDSNDHAPEFSPEPTGTKVSELFRVGNTVYNLGATDVDEAIENHRAFFEIDGGNIGDTFRIDSEPSDGGKSLGYLKLQKELDFEDGITSFNLRVKVYNKEALNNATDAMASFGDVLITVTDGNEPPEFLDTPYTDTISEAAKPGVLVAVQPRTRDRDFGGNQSVTYSIDSDPNDWFEIDSKTGQIKTKSSLDREARNVVDSVYNLVITATDNYPTSPASQNEKIAITIDDINDNPPVPDWGSAGPTAYVCKIPENTTVTRISAVDPDDNTAPKRNGVPFEFWFDSSVDPGMWRFDPMTESSALVVTFVKKFDNVPEKGYELPFSISDNGSPIQTGTYTLTVSVCACTDRELDCEKFVPIVAGFPVAIIIAIIVVLILVIILVLAAIAYKRRKDAMVLKEPFFEDEDDVRENMQVYHEEGGEEDQDAYDLSALRAPLLDEPHAPVRIEEKPLQQAPRMPRGAVPDDIGEYIGDAKDQADNDPSAPPFDSLLVFDYEGLGSEAGSLSSINTATTDGSMDYDYLNDWGPRFKKLSDMYNGGSDEE